MMSNEVSVPRIGIPLLVVVATLYLMKSTGIFPKNTFGVPLTLTLWVAFTFACLIAPALAVLGHVRRLQSDVLKPAAILLITGLTGWILFWAWFVDPAFGRIFSIATLSISAISLFCYPVSLAYIGRPIAFVFIISTAFTAITFDHGGFDNGAGVAQNRYWLTTDNHIPKAFADKLMQGRENLLPTIQGDWQSSDRPPLETGMMFSSYGFTKEKARNLSYFVLGVLTNSLWIFGIWALLRALKVDERNIGFIVLATATVGAVFTNTVYAWPKLLAGAMTLGAIACVVRSKEESPRLCFAVAGAVAALAMLSHGAAIFGLLGFSAYLAFTKSIPNIRNIAICSIAAVVLYAPWVAYQKLYDAPGDRLLKWQLAGMSERNVNIGTLDAIVSGYRNAGLDQVIENKINSVRLYLTDPTFDNGLDKTYPIISTGWVRWHTVFRMGPVPLFLLMALPLLLARKFYSYRSSRFLMANIALSSVVFIGLVFGEYPSSSAAVHTAPFSVLLMWCAIFPLAVSQVTPRLLPYYTALTSILFFLLWVVDVPNGTALGYYSDTLSADGVIYSMRILPLAMLGLAFYLAYGWHRQTENAQQIHYAKS